MADIDKNKYVMENKFGENANVSVGNVPQDIWLVGGDFPFPVAARQMTVHSTSALDDGDPQGLGAGSVVAVYLDGDYEQHTTSTTLDGTTLVNVGNLLTYRINRGYIDIAGNGTNAGTLIFMIGGTVVGRIDPNRGQTLQGVYTVPARYKYAELRRFSVDIGKKAVPAYARVELQFRPPGGAWRVQDVLYPQTTGNSHNRTEYDIEQGPRFPVGADIRVRCTDVSTNDVLLTTKFTIAKQSGADIVTSAT